MRTPAETETLQAPGDEEELPAATAIGSQPEIIVNRWERQTILNRKSERIFV